MCNDALAQFKASLYYVYFKDLPDDLISQALEQADCLPGASFIQQSCPKIYCKWLIATAQKLLLDLVDSVITVDDNGDPLTDPIVNVNEACATPNTFLKKRKVMDVECEWQEMKSCLDCDEDTRKKLGGIADMWLEKCEKACRTLGLGLIPCNPMDCYTCEGGKIRRLGGNG